MHQSNYAPLHMDLWQGQNLTCQTLSLRRNVFHLSKIMMSVRPPFLLTCEFGKVRTASNNGNHNDSVNGMYDHIIIPKPTLCILWMYLKDHYFAHIFAGPQKRLWLNHPIRLTLCNCTPLAWIAYNRMVMQFTSFDLRSVEEWKWRRKTVVLKVTVS